MAADYPALTRCDACGDPLTDKRVSVLKEVYHVDCLLIIAKGALLECVLHSPDLIAGLLDWLLTELSVNVAFVADLLYEANRQALLQIRRAGADGDVGSSEYNPIVIDDEQ